MTAEQRASYTVLVVDDDPSVLATYRRLLRRAGYDTVAEQDPRRVLDEGIAERGVHLMLVDYRMPGMDGLTLLAELRRRECRCRVVLISAYLNDEVRCQAENLGVARVLEKLRRTIEELLPLGGEPLAGIAG